MTKENPTSLCDLKKNEEALITNVDAGDKATKRLVDMGLTPNTPIKVLRKTLFCGPIEIEVRGSKLVLGQKLATKISVKTLDPRLREDDEKEKH